MRETGGQGHSPENPCQKCEGWDKTMWEKYFKTPPKKQDNKGSKSNQMQQKSQEVLLPQGSTEGSVSSGGKSHSKKNKKPSNAGVTSENSQVSASHRSVPPPERSVLMALLREPQSHRGVLRGSSPGGYRAGSFPSVWLSFETPQRFREIWVTQLSFGAVHWPICLTAPPGELPQ